MSKKLITIILFIIFISNLFSQGILNFAEGFEELHTQLSTQYAFTNWKKINWNKLHSEFQPKMITASNNNDSTAIYLTLRKYLYSIPDGHIAMFDVPSTSRWTYHKNRAKFKECGGSYGFLLTKLDNDKIIVRYVDKNSSADSAGIEFGDEIIEINDTEINTALSNTKVTWAELAPATNTDLLLNQLRFIDRDSLNSSMKLKFKKKVYPRRVHKDSFYC